MRMSYQKGLTNLSDQLDKLESELKETQAELRESVQKEEKKEAATKRFQGLD